MAAKLGVDV